MRVPTEGISGTLGSANFLAEDDLAHYRTWRDKSGKFSVVAKMLGLKDGSVLLLRKDGKRVAVPLVKLSEDDRSYFRSVVNHLPKEPIEIEKQNGIEQATETKIRGATRHQFEGYRQIRSHLTTDVVHIVRVKSNLPPYSVSCLLSHLSEAAFRLSIPR